VTLPTLVFAVAFALVGLTAALVSRRYGARNPRARLAFIAVGFALAAAYVWTDRAQSGAAEASAEAQE